MGLRRIEPNEIKVLPEHTNQGEIFIVKNSSIEKQIGMIFIHSYTSYVCLADGEYYGNFGPDVRNEDVIHPSWEIEILRKGERFEIT